MPIVIKKGSQFSLLCREPSRFWKRKSSNMKVANMKVAEEIECHVWKRRETLKRKKMAIIFFLKK